MCVVCSAQWDWLILTVHYTQHTCRSTTCCHIT